MSGSGWDEGRGDELWALTIGELSERIRSGALSPVELTAAFLERIERLEPELNAFITVTADTALATARAAETDIRRDGPRSPLHGIPLAHKDIVDVAGLATTCGSALLADNIAAANATVIDRLEAAGAIMLGKLNMNEFATLIPSDHFGPVRSPWAADRSPGGSSSGSGAAVAAGLCAAALGTDTGGSIRIPAAFGGVTGLKATHGRVSTHGVTPLAWSLDHIGPLTRTARDAALVLQAVAGYDAQDLCARDVPVPDYTAGIDAGVGGRRLAVPRDFFAAMTDAETANALAQALGVLRGLGARVEEVALPDVGGAWAAAEAIICAEASTWHAPHLERAPERYGPKVRRFLERARATTAPEYVRALRAKAAFRRALLATLASYDALVVPGALVPPPALEARELAIAGRSVRVLDAVVSATAPFNLTGQPALAVPCGFTPDGLPLSMQIVGRPFDEATVLAIGHAFQQATDWHTRRPPL